MDLQSHVDPGRGSERSFGWVFAVVFLLVALWPLMSGSDVWWWALIVAIGLALAAEIRPHWLRMPNRAWTHIGEAVGRVVSPFVLLLVYCVAVVPVGLLMKLFGKDPLHRSIDRTRATYWVDREDAPQSMKRQF